MTIIDITILGKCTRFLTQKGDPQNRSIVFYLAGDDCFLSVRKIGTFSSNEHTQLNGIAFAIYCISI